MIPLLIYAQAADLVTFAFAAGAIGFHGNEYGALANAMYDFGGIPAIAFTKIVIVVMFAVLAASFRRKYPALGGILIGIGFSMGTFGALANVAALAVSV